MNKAVQESGVLFGSSGNFIIIRLLVLSRCLDRNRKRRETLPNEALGRVEHVKKTCKFMNREDTVHKGYSV